MAAEDRGAFVQAALTAVFSDILPSVAVVRADLHAVRRNHRGVAHLGDVQVLDVALVLPAGPDEIELAAQLKDGAVDRPAIVRSAGDVVTRVQLAEVFIRAL